MIRERQMFSATGPAKGIPNLENPNALNRLLSQKRVPVLSHYGGERVYAEIPQSKKNNGRPMTLVLTHEQAEKVQAGIQEYFQHHSHKPTEEGQRAADAEADKRLMRYRAGSGRVVMR